MKKHFRAICLLIAVLLCASVFVACKGEEGGTSSTVTQNSQTTNEGFSYGPADYGEFPYKDVKYDDDEPIRILCVEADRHKYGVQQFTYVEELEGNTINSAVQERNNYIEENYGITFETTTAKYPNEEIVNVIAGGLDEYDLISESVDRLVLGIASRYYWSLDDVMNLNHPWWDKEAIEALALGERHYIIAGDAIITDDDNTYLTLFNKDMFKTNTALSEKGDIYQLVRDGEFTIDLYYELCRAVSKADDNGLWGFNATYGNLSHAYGATVMMNGCGIATVAKNENNELYINVMEQNSVNAFNKVYELMSDSQNTQRAELIAGQSTSSPSQYGFAELEEMFVNGRGLFYNTTSGSISILKSANLDFEFGVLPIPKLNKEQENYCNTVNRYQSTGLAIPTTVPAARLEKIAFALQTLGFYNADVIRAYYQTTLQLQAVQSDDDAEMLDIVYNNRFYDIGAIYEWGKLVNLYGSVIANSSANTLVSSWEAMESAVQSAMEQAVIDYNNAA
ncbi:MAG: extracellular solute-binding protein [Clostridia bacterium]|nr:extracellular solute-binding protein [Clostridia bacterium]